MWSRLCGRWGSWLDGAAQQRDAPDEARDGLRTARPSQVISALDRLKENKHDHSNEEQIASGCCGHRGYLPHVGDWVRSNEYSRAAAPLSSGWCGHRGQIAACAVGEGHVLNRASGHFDLDDAGAAVGLLRPAARHRSVGQSGTVAVSGCVIHRCMESRSSVRVRRAATRVIQHAGAPPGDRCAGSSRETGAAVRCCGTAGESHGPGVRRRHRASARAARRGYSRGVALSNIARGWRSFDRPVQHANGAVAPACLCDHGAAARGSFATLNETADRGRKKPHVRTPVILVPA